MKQPFFLASCAVIFAATLRAQTLDPEGAVQSFKSQFEAAKAVPQAAAGGNDKQNFEALFQAMPDGRSWTVSSSEPVDGKLLRISVTTADAFAHVKALGWWGTAGKSQVFTSKEGKIDGYRFVVAFKAPKSPQTPSCVTIACGVNVEPASLADKT